MISGEGECQCWCGLMIKRARIVLAIGVTGLGGCLAPHGPKTVTNPDPVAKIPAIEDAVAHHDLSVAPQLVRDLDDEDPAIRFYAQDGLQRLTGQSFGYHYYDSADQRRPAILKWRTWLTNRGPK